MEDSIKVKSLPKLTKCIADFIAHSKWSDCFSLLIRYLLNIGLFSSFLIVT